MRADQTALELGALLAGDVPGGQGSEAGRDAVVRLVVLGQPVDDVPAVRDRGEGVVGQPDPARAAGHPDHVVRRHRADAHENDFGLHTCIAHRRGDRRLVGSTWSCPGSQTMCGRQRDESTCSS